MTYQELMQKKIEEASIDYQLSERPICLGGDAFADDVRRLNINQSFIAGANFLLDNLWFSVDESLPEIEEIVLVCIFDTSDEKDHTYNVGFFTGEKQFFFLLGYGTTDKVTHWMPIPPLKISKIANQGEVSHIWKDGSGRLISDYERNIAVEKYKKGGKKCSQS